MSRVFLLVIALLAGCSTSKTALVYQDEFVLWADGWFCEYAPKPKGVVRVSGGNMWCGDRPARAPGIYVVDGNGHVLDQEGKGKAKKVEDVAQEGRECERYRSQGIACAPNFFIELEATNDPRYAELWGLSGKGINAPQLWRDGESAPDIRVAVIDTGVMCEHADIGGCASSFDAVTGQVEQIDDNGHGTHCAGTACALGNNSEGIVGVSQRCQVLAGKFMGATGGGSLAAAVKAVDWAIKQDAHIISASWGSDFGNAVLEKAIRKADEAGVLFIAAAGNDRRNTDEQPQYPANYDYPNVISVAAHDSDGKLASFSNFGAESVEVVAPGVSILSTWKDGSYHSISGTSMATPHVAGLAAVLWQRELGKGTKREQMLRVRDAIFAMGTEELRNRSRFGIVRAAQSCKPKKCKQCMSECDDSNCRAWRRCKRECRVSTQCGKRCVNEEG